MKKRILSILLLCCMVLTLLPTTAFAAGKNLGRHRGGSYLPRWQTIQSIKSP